MKKLNTMAGQGDVMLINLDAFSEKNKKRMGFDKCSVRESQDGEHYIVTHSETGHHHVIEKSKVVEMLIDNTNQFIARMKLQGDDTVIEHLRSFDTHEEIKLPNNIGIKRQREYTAEGFRKAQD